MKNVLYSVYDRAVQSFGQPILAANELMVKRSLVDLFLFEVVKPEAEQHQYVRYADSFDLYLIGEFESGNGVISPMQPVMIMRLAEFKGN